MCGCGYDRLVRKAGEMQKWLSEVTDASHRQMCDGDVECVAEVQELDVKYLRDDGHEEMTMWEMMDGEKYPQAIDMTGQMV